MRFDYYCLKVKLILCAMPLSLVSIQLKYVRNSHMKFPLHINWSVDSSLDLMSMIYSPFVSFLSFLTLYSSFILHRVMFCANNLLTITYITSIDVCLQISFQIQCLPHAEYDQRKYSISGSFCTLSLYMYTGRHISIFFKWILFPSKPLIGFCLANLRALFFPFTFPMTSILWYSVFFFFSALVRSVLHRNRKSCLFLYWFKRGFRFFFFCGLCECEDGFFFSIQYWTISTQVWRFITTKRFYGHYTCFIVLRFAIAFFFLLILGWQCMLSHFFNALWSLIWLLDWIFALKRTDSKTWRMHSG